MLSGGRFSVVVRVLLLFSEELKRREEMSGESWDPNRVYECSGEPEMTHIEVLFSLEQYRALDKLLVELGQGIEQYILPSESRECCYVSEWEDVPDTEVLVAQVNALLGEPSES